METITVPASVMHVSLILNHKEFVGYLQADRELQNRSRGIDGVQGFLDGKAVVVDYSK